MSNTMPIKVWDEYNMKYFLLNVTDSMPHLQNKHILYIVI